MTRLQFFKREPMIGVCEVNQAEVSGTDNDDRLCTCRAGRRQEVDAVRARAGRNAACQEGAEPKPSGLLGKKRADPRRALRPSHGLRDDRRAVHELANPLTETLSVPLLERRAQALPVI